MIWSLVNWSVAGSRLLQNDKILCERAASAELLQSTLHCTGLAGCSAGSRARLLVPRCCCSTSLSPHRPGKLAEQTGESWVAAAPDWTLPSRRWWPVWERGGLCTAGLTLAGPPTRHSAAKSAGRVWPAQQDSRAR